MFCPQCRHMYTAEKRKGFARKITTVRDVKCPSCGVLLVRDRMAVEFPRDDFALHATVRPITVSEVMRETITNLVGQLRDRGLDGVPVARTVLIEVGCRAGEPPQRIAEDGGRFAGHDAAELDPAVLQPPMGSLRQWR